jgi:ABC-2 type transport system permease protein
MRGFRKLILTNIKLYVREPISSFFTLVFSPMLLVIFGAIYGNAPSAMFGGRGSMDVSIPGYIGLIVAGVGILSMPINISAQRESGVLRRFQASPLKPLAYILADLISNLVVTILGIIILLIVGKLIYNVQFSGSVISVMLAVLLGCLAMFAIGYLIASLAPNARAGQVIGMVLLYPMMFISGAGMPLEIMPQTIRTIARFMPLYYVVNLTKGLWFGESWSAYLLDVVVLICIVTVGFGIASRFFKWK